MTDAANTTADQIDALLRRAERQHSLNDPEGSLTLLREANNLAGLEQQGEPHPIPLLRLYVWVDTAKVLYTLQRWPQALASNEIAAEILERAYPNFSAFFNLTTFEQKNEVDWLERRRLSVCLDTADCLRYLQREEEALIVYQAATKILGESNSTEDKEYVSSQIDIAVGRANCLLLLSRDQEAVEALDNVDKIVEISDLHRMGEQRAKIAVRLANYALQEGRLEQALNEIDAGARFLKEPNYLGIEQLDAERDHVRLARAKYLAFSGNLAKSMVALAAPLWSLDRTAIVLFALFVFIIGLFLSMAALLSTSPVIMISWLFALAAPAPFVLPYFNYALNPYFVIDRLSWRNSAVRVDLAPTSFMQTRIKRRHSVRLPNLVERKYWLELMLKLVVLVGLLHAFVSYIFIPIFIGFSTIGSGTFFYLSQGMGLFYIWRFRAIVFLRHDNGKLKFKNRYIAALRSLRGTKDYQIVERETDLPLSGNEHEVFGSIPRLQNCLALHAQLGRQQNSVSALPVFAGLMAKTMGWILIYFVSSLAFAGLVTWLTGFVA